MQKELDLVQSLHAKHGPIWRGKDGSYVPIKMMESRHLVNCHRMMVRRATEAIMPLAYTKGPSAGVEEALAQFAAYCMEWAECLGQEIDRRHLDRLTAVPESYPTFRIVDILPSGEPWRIDVL